MRKRLWPAPSARRCYLKVAVEREINCVWICAGYILGVYDQMSFSRLICPPSNPNGGTAENPRGTAQPKPFMKSVESLSRERRMYATHIGRLNRGRPCAYVSRPATRGAGMRNIICIGALLGVILLVRSGLHAALAAYGFWPYMAICGGLTATIIAAAFAWDHVERSRR
jgi:hypothetical protein